MIITVRTCLPTGMKATRAIGIGLVARSFGHSWRNSCNGADVRISRHWGYKVLGELFIKVTLTSYDYTVMAKGTARAYVKDLQHEAEVYPRLAAIHGVYAPVFLGNLDLDYPFYYETGVLIVHMMLLSWSIHCLLKKTSNDENKEKRKLDLIRAVKAIHDGIDGGRGDCSKSGGLRAMYIVQ